MSLQSRIFIITSPPNTTAHTQTWSLSWKSQFLASARFGSLQLYYCLPPRSPHSLDPIHLSLSLLPTSPQEPAALFRPGSLLTTNLICPLSPVYLVKFLLLIGTTSDSLAMCQAFYLNYLIICIMLSSNKLKSTAIIPISYKSWNLGVRQLNRELRFSPHRLTLICHVHHSP